jgi:hypothetical protein
MMGGPFARTGCGVRGICQCNCNNECDGGTCNCRKKRHKSFHSNGDFCYSRILIIRSPRLQLGEFEFLAAKKAFATLSANNGLMHRSKSTSLLFDHLVGAQQQRCRHFDAECLGGLEVHHQFELGRLFDRQVGRLRTLENLVDESGGPTTKIWNIAP